MATPCESDDDANNREVQVQLQAGDSMMVEEEPNLCELEWFKSINREQKGHKGARNRKTEHQRQETEKRKEPVNQKAKRRQRAELTKGNIEHQRASEIQGILDRICQTREVKELATKRVCVLQWLGESKNHPAKPICFRRLTLNSYIVILCFKTK